MIGSGFIQYSCSFRDCQAIRNHYDDLVRAPAGARDSEFNHREADRSLWNLSPSSLAPRMPGRYAG